jgi:hypothetical protein
LWKTSKFHGLCSAIQYYILNCRSEFELYETLQEFLAHFPNQLEYPHINYTDKEQFVLFVSANYMKVFCSLLENTTNHMEHCVRSSLLSVEGKDHRKITFGTGAAKGGLEPFARRRRFVQRFVSGRKFAVFFVTHRIITHHYNFVGVPCKTRTPKKRSAGRGRCSDSETSDEDFDDKETRVVFIANGRQQAVVKASSLSPRSHRHQTRHATLLAAVPPKSAPSPNTPRSAAKKKCVKSRSRMLSKSSSPLTVTALREHTVRQDVRKCSSNASLGSFLLFSNEELSSDNSLLDFDVLRNHDGNTDHEHISEHSYCEAEIKLDWHMLGSVY